MPNRHTPRLLREKAEFQVGLLQNLEIRLRGILCPNIIYLHSYTDICLYEAFAYEFILDSRGAKAV